MPEQESPSHQAIPRWLQSLSRRIWKVALLLGSLVILPLVINTVSTWLVSPNGILPSNAPVGLLIAGWPITILISCCLFLIALLARVVSQWPVQTFYPNPLLTPDQEYRIRLLKRVRTIWVEGLLENSLQRAILIDLHLQEQPNVLENPWRLEIQELNRYPRPLPVGTSIIQVYDKADGELLILGEPGAGKTTLLLQLAKELLNRAEANEHHRVPVVLNLSSWAEKGLSLRDWLTEELNGKYSIPTNTVERWISTNQIIPLLDGLDEVPENARFACLRAITSYQQQRLHKSGITPIVICCRIEEFQALSQTIKLQQAVTIQPLSDEDINRYIQSIPFQSKELHRALHSDPDLFKLVHRPLMLNIFTLAYVGTAASATAIIGLQSKLQHQLFAAYVQRMLMRRGVSKHFTQEQFMRGLTFLAAYMQRRPMNSIMLVEPVELIEISLVISFIDKKPYRDLSSLNRKIANFLSLLVLILFSAFIAILVVGNLLDSNIINFCAPLLLYLIGFALSTFVGNQLINFNKFWIWGWMRKKNNLKEYLKEITIKLLSVLMLILSLIQIGRLVLFMPTFVINETIPSERILIYLLIIGILLGLFGSLMQILFTKWWNNHSPIAWLGGSLKGVPTIMILTFLSFILSFSVFLGGIEGVTIGLLLGFFWLLAMPEFQDRSWIDRFMKYYWLWRTGKLPWDIETFLQEATERLLLRKVGDEYIFIHRLLLDYLASLDDST